MSASTVRVKSVTSGDTLVVGLPSGEQRQYSLAFVGAPRLSATAHEPFGFEAREFLRSLLIGKTLALKPLYTINGRDYADFSSPIFTSLIAYTLENGWARLRDDSVSKTGYEEYHGTLEAAQKKAESAERGIWKEGAALSIRVRREVPYELYGSHRQIPSIVERVVAGDRIQIRTLMDRDDQFLGLAALAGIRAPRTASTVDGSGGEPFGEAARQFVAAKLLQRNQVRAVYVAPSPNSSANASPLPLVEVVHPAGDVALLLVKEGLAMVAENQAAEVGSDRILSLRAAQKEAELAGRNIWQLRKQRKEQLPSGYDAAVIRVVSSDTLVLDNGKTVQLSSTRAPRRNDPETAPFVDAAREYARKLLIGQHVTVSTDAVRPASGQFEERDLVTVNIDGRNAALDIIRAGWATVVFHRRDDDDRSPFIDELKTAETEAADAKRGLHGKAPKQSNKIVDASESVVRARGFLSSLERRSRIPAIVQHVSSGGRLRLEVPSENCTLTAVLEGVRVPRPTDDFGKEALDYTLRHFGQREVQITVRSVDKTGAFISHVYHGKGEAGSLALKLLSEGLASIHAPSANFLEQRTALENAQDSAKHARKGMWKNYDPVAEAAAALEAAKLEKAAEAEDKEDGGAQGIYQDARVTNVTPELLWFRLASVESRYQQMRKSLASFFGAAANSDARRLERPPRRGDAVTVALPGNLYARARILAFDKKGTYDILFVDTGKEDTLDIAQILPLPQQFQLQAVPEFAKSTQLKYIHAPPKNHAAAYVDFIEQQTTKPVVVLLSSAGANVFTEDSQAVTDSLNSRLVKSGCAAVPVAVEKHDEAAPLLKLQREAMQDHIGMWQYGDPRDDDDL